MHSSQFVTGHEARFDFPHTHLSAPRTPYLLASTPRAGSSLLSHRLWATGGLGAPLEYLNFAPLGPQGDGANEPTRQMRYWQNALVTRTSPNGVFGVKTFPLQMEELNRDNPALLRAVFQTLFAQKERSRIVFLKRRDRVAHAISYARAMQTGLWRREQELAADDRLPQPEYSGRMVEQAARLLQAQERAWDGMIADLRLRPLVVWHEDVLENPEQTVTAIAQYLGVTLRADMACDVPTIERQAQDNADAWRAAYDADSSFRLT